VSPSSNIASGLYELLQERPIIRELVQLTRSCAQHRGGIIADSTTTRGWCISPVPRLLLLTRFSIRR